MYSAVNAGVVQEMLHELIVICTADKTHGKIAQECVDHASQQGE